MTIIPTSVELLIGDEGRMMYKLICEKTDTILGESTSKAALERLRSVYLLYGHACWIMTVILSKAV